MRGKDVRSIVRGAVAVAVLIGGGGAACYDFSSVTGGPPRDAGADASTGGGGGGDGSSSADSSPAGGGGFCASLSPTPNFFFCDDFDDYETSSLTKWDQSIEANGTVGLTSIAPFSKPNAMSAQTSIAAVGVNTEADVLKAFSTYADRGIELKTSFEMDIEQWDPATSGQIIAFEVIFKGLPPQFNQIALNLNSLGVGGVSAQIAENATGADGGAAGYNSYPFKSPPVTKGWTKVEVTVSVPNPVGATSNTVTVTLDGVTQMDAQPLQVPLQKGWTPDVHLGISVNNYAAPAGAWVVQYDNFVTTITPF